MRGVLHRVELGVCVLVTILALTPPIVAANAASPWIAGPGAVGDDTYAGFIDTPASGATVVPNSMVTVQGWAVDQSAVGWSGIDDVQVYLGVQDQGGTLMVHASVGQKRDDVVAATGNPDWATSGFSGSFAASALAVGTNTLTIYLHTPDKGSWFRQLQVSVLAAPDRAFADDPLLIVREADPSLDVSSSTLSLILSGYAIDRNLPMGQSLGVGGSGVSSVFAYLDGPRNGGGGTPGVFAGNATLGIKNREATGFGDRFLMSGFELTLHPNDLSVDRHALYIYAESAYWPSETLVIVPFTIS
jgi:hypothetical protein